MTKLDFANLRTGQGTGANPQLNDLHAFICAVSPPRPENPPMQNVDLPRAWWDCFVRVAQRLFIRARTASHGPGGAQTAEVDNIPRPGTGGLGIVEFPMSQPKRTFRPKVTASPINNQPGISVNTPVPSAPCRRRCTLCRKTNHPASPPGAHMPTRRARLTYHPGTRAIEPASPQPITTAGASPPSRTITFDPTPIA